MPNFDAGHYFLTVLAPVRTDPVRHDGQSHSRRHLLKEILAQLPTAQTTVASKEISENPFARCKGVHFARFALLDDVVFNGRAPQNSILRSLEGVDPIVPQGVDSLTTPYLVFVADFDAPDGSDEALRSITDGLWTAMSHDISKIFRHCWAFDEDVGQAEFFAYIKNCQIETTMPFNDYWVEMPALPSFGLTAYGVVGVVALLVLLMSFLGGLPWILLASLFVLIADVVLVLRGLVAAGQKPFPLTPPGGPQSDLRTILKALTVQRAFTDFAIATQTAHVAGASDAALYETFSVFLATYRPLDLDAPTQLPGVIGV